MYKARYQGPKHKTIAALTKERGAMSSGMLVEPRAKRNFDERRGGDGRLPFLHLISLLLLFVLLLSPPSLLPRPHPPEMTRTEAQAVVDAIRGWDGARPGDLFASIRRARPGAGAITSMRELNRYASGLSPEVQNMITENQRIAQETIRQRILDVRTRVIRLYLQRHPEHARSLYGYGDIGSWALSNGTAAHRRDGRRLDHLRRRPGGYS